MFLVGRLLPRAGAGESALRPRVRRVLPPQPGHRAGGLV